MKAIMGFSVVVMLLMAAGPANADVTFFLSDKGLGEGAALGNPTIEVASVGLTATLYLWANADQAVNGIGLNVVANDPTIVQATASEMYDPSYYDAGAFPAPKTYYRWAESIGQGVLGDLVLGINMVALSDVRLVVGLNPDWKIDGLMNWEAAAGAWLLGEITVEGMVEGSTPVHLTVSGDFITPPGGLGADMVVWFGDGESTPLDGEDVGVESAVVDATITVLPEPMTLALLGVGAVGLLARKRR